MGAERIVHPHTLNPNLDLNRFERSASKIRITMITIKIGNATDTPNSAVEFRFFLARRAGAGLSLCSP